jgi:hypothetical protein
VIVFPPDYRALSLCCFFYNDLGSSYFWKLQYLLKFLKNAEILDIVGNSQLSYLLPITFKFGKLQAHNQNVLSSKVVHQDQFCHPSPCIFSLCILPNRQTLLTIQLKYIKRKHFYNYFLLPFFSFFIK